jgi:glycosyltransferase involved in cell wall biosynthesis
MIMRGRGPQDDSSTNRFASTQPRVSIVTPSYNQGKYIERTILSVLKQDYQNIQYIVLDSRSTDQTHRILNRYRKQIDIVIEEKDNGQSDAINKGFAKADGEILAWLNSDDLYAAPDVVSKAVEHLVKNPQTDLAYGKRYYIDRSGWFHVSYPYREFNEAQLNAACYIPQECCFWTREIYDRAGSYINLNYQFAMDYELWLRFLKHGARFESIDAVFGYFRWYEEQKSVDIWETVGIPEIARLQTEYGLPVISSKSLQDKFMEHYFKVNRSTDPDKFDRCHKLWSEEIRVKQHLFQFAALDHWVIQRPNSKEMEADERRVS